MSDDRFDQAIDRAVREMMNVEPDASIRARVLAELTRPAPRVLTPRNAFVAAATLLLIALVLVRVPRPGRPTEIALKSQPVTAPVTPGLDKPAVAPDMGTQLQSAPRAMRSARERVIHATATVELPATIPPLVEIAPLAVVPPRAADIEPRAVTIAPLDDLADLRVEPLPFPPGWRN